MVLLFCACWDGLGKRGFIWSGLVWSISCFAFSSFLLFCFLFLTYLTHCHLIPSVPGHPPLAFIQERKTERRNLDVKSRGLGLGQLRLVRLQRLLNLSGSELLHLLGRAAHEGARVQEAVQLVQDRGEEGGAADSVEEVVVLAVFLYLVGGFVREDACFGLGKSRVSGVSQREGRGGSRGTGGGRGSVRMSSWASCRERPFFTQAMMTYILVVSIFDDCADQGLLIRFGKGLRSHCWGWLANVILRKRWKRSGLTYVAMKGSSSLTRRRMTSG